MYKTNATGPFFRSSVGRVHATCTYDPTVLEDSLKLLATENKYDIGGKLLKNVKYPYGLSQKGLDRRVVESYEYDRLGQFNEYFTYDDQGRITSQRRGGGRGGVSETGGEYGYYAGTNKLEKVANGMGGKSAEKRKMDDAGNFVYDSEGNLIEDRSKKMKISYDWRGMPVEFVRQDVCENGKCASTRLTLDYDGSGRRISKTVWRKAAGESGWTKDNVTHYTGIGTEVRENFAGSTPGAKVVVSLPEGLGRYAPGDASENVDARPLKDENGNELAGMLPGTNFEWYLKNHLGSTMLVFGTQSSASPDASDNGTLKAAYDYHAFGEQLTLVDPTDKVTENFTGKGIRGERCDSRVYSIWHCRAEEHCAQRNERDDEIELNYFGARYLDPMLGLWTSVDPARQFSSPYLYAGNGYNSVNVVDPNGMEDIYLLRGSGLLKNRQYINWPYNEWKERLKPSVEMMKNKGYSVFVGPVKDATVFAKLIKDPDAKRAFYVGHIRGNKEGKPDALSSYSNKAIVASVFGSYSNKSVELYLFGCNSKSLENSEWDSVFPKITGNTDNPIPLETMTEEFFNAVEKYATELPQKE